MASTLSAVKVTFGSTEVIFDRAEIVAVEFIEKSLYQIHGRQAGNPDVVDFGSPDSSLRVVFDLRRNDTAAKIQSLLDAGEELTVYYSYQFSPESTMKVIPIADQTETVEVFGFREAHAQRALQFIKSGE
jgi:hypothetical protein